MFEPFFVHDVSLSVSICIDTTCYWQTNARNTLILSYRICNVLFALSPSPPEVLSNQPTLSSSLVTSETTSASRDEIVLQLDGIHAVAGFMVSVVGGGDGDSSAYVSVSARVGSDGDWTGQTLQSVSRSVDPSFRRSVDPSIRRSVDPSIRGSVDPSVRRSVDPSVRGSVDPSVRRSVGP